MSGAGVGRGVSYLAFVRGVGEGEGLVQREALLFLVERLLQNGRRRKQDALVSNQRLTLEEK